MNITPKHNWIQFDDTIQVTIYNIFGINKANIKHFIQVTPIYFNLNFSPYLFQIDFENEIDPFHIKLVIINKGEIKFIFPKKIKNKIWSNLNTNKSKEMRLKLRRESIDRLYEKQRKIREKRNKEKKLRFKAAENRQWNQEKKVKNIINKLETKEKQKSKYKLREWIDTINDKYEDDDHPNNDNNNQNVTEIRKSNIVEIGFSEWNYIIPIRENTKPPQFALKTVDIVDNDNNISEKTPIFMLDKGIKYFINKDYQSAINIFDQAIKINNNKDFDLYLLLHCNKIQCFIKLGMIPNNIDIDIDNHNKSNSIIINSVIFLQKGIIKTFMIFEQILNGIKIDEKELLSIIEIFNKGLKQFQINQKMNKLQNNFGLFKDIENLKDLNKISNEKIKIINIIKKKYFTDKLIKIEDEMNNAINGYTEIIKELESIKTNGNICKLLLFESLNNRIILYLKTKQFLKCINDCDKMIENYDINNDKDYKVYIRRGACYLSLWKISKQDNNNDYFTKSLNDYKIATKYNKIYKKHVLKMNKLQLLFK